jgi:hypothetical protein
MSRDYNIDAQIYEQQIVISDTTSASITSGALTVEGGFRAADTHIVGHAAVNNVKITPNLNDIIYEQEQQLSQSITVPTNVPNFYFDNSVCSSFKAYINVNVNAGISKYAFWEINGVYKPSGDGWSINSSFTGDLTGVNFSIFNDSSEGRIRYTNTNGVGSTTTIRFRATTNAPPGSVPFSSSSIINNTSGPFVPDRILYASTIDTIASTDLEYNSNLFSIGGNSRIIARNANEFVNFSNGGGITSMGDISAAKKIIVGQKVGIANTAPTFALDVSGDINFTGTFYKDGSPYTGSSIWDSNGNNVYFTTGNLGIGTQLLLIL